MRVLHLVTLAVVLTASACGAVDSGGSASDEPSGAASSAAPDDVTTLEPTDPTLPPSQGTGKAQAEVEHTGTLADGVEAGCVLLETGSGSPLLLLGPGVSAFSAGDRVTVRGVPQPDAMTTCMQGQPFAVSEISAAG